MYQIRILDEASRELRKLDKPVGRRVARRLRWLAANLDEIRLEPLTGSLVGLFKLRVGDYRVVYEVLRSENTIVVHLVGHRADIYRR